MSARSILTGLLFSIVGGLLAGWIALFLLDRCEKPDFRANTMEDVILRP